MLVGSPGVNKVDVMLSRRQQLKKHVHSKLAKLRGIRVIDDSGSSTTTSPAVGLTHSELNLLD